MTAAPVLPGPLLPCGRDPVLCQAMRPNADKADRPYANLLRTAGTTSGALCCQPMPAFCGLDQAQGAAVTRAVGRCRRYV